MIVKLIPETEQEKEEIKSTEHKNVKEFFLVGVKIDVDGDSVDFHAWNGGHKFLLQNLSWYKTVIEDDKHLQEIKDIFQPSGTTKPKVSQVQDAASQLAEVATGEGPTIKTIELPLAKE